MAYVFKVATGSTRAGEPRIDLNRPSLQNCLPSPLREDNSYCCWAGSGEG